MRIRKLQLEALASAPLPGTLDLSETLAWIMLVRSAEAVRP